MGSNSDSTRPASESVTLIDNSTGKQVILPLIGGSVGPKVIDIRKLYAETGMFTALPIMPPCGGPDVTSTISLLPRRTSSSAASWLSAST